MKERVREYTLDLESIEKMKRWAFLSAARARGWKLDPLESDDPERDLALLYASAVSDDGQWVVAGRAEDEE